MNHIEKINKFNERHIEVRLKSLVITNSYAPDSSYSSIDRDRYWEKLQENIYKVTDNKITHIWTTDNNGQLGMGNKNPFIGPHARVKNHEKGNGQKLAATMKSLKLRAVNTFFYKHCASTDKLATWTSPCGRYMKQLDYILINQHRANWVKNAYTLGPANRANAYGHKIVVANIETSYKKIHGSIKNKKTHNNFDTHAMRNDYDNLEPLNTEIFSKIKWLPNDSNVVKNLRGHQLAGPLNENEKKNENKNHEKDTSLNKNIDQVTTEDIDNTWHYITRKINNTLKEKYKKKKGTLPTTDNLNEIEKTEIKNLEQIRKTTQEDELEENKMRNEKANMQKIHIAFDALKAWKDLNKIQKIEDVHGDIIDMTNNRMKIIKNAYKGVSINNHYYENQVALIHIPHLWEMYHSPMLNNDRKKSDKKRKQIFKKKGDRDHQQD